MNQPKKFSNAADKNMNLLFRGAAAYPIRQDAAALKQRHENGDPNVAPYLDTNGQVEYYSLEFTSNQRQELENAYCVAAGINGRLDDCATIFVSTIESYGASIPDLRKIAPPTQKNRQRAFESFALGIEKMDAALSELDSGALGWLYAHIADNLAVEGIQLSRDDGEVASMKNHPHQAMVEAGELRAKLRRLACSVSRAAADARETLPQAERVENDPRMTVAKWLERDIIENRIEFSTAETGFPAQCLRAVFELGGLEVEKMGYWLKKAAEAPDSLTRSRQQMDEKTEGNNPPLL